MEAKRARQRKLSDASAINGISMTALRSVMAKLEIEGASRRQLLQAYHVRFDVVVIHEDLARKKRGSVPLGIRGPRGALTCNARGEPATTGSVPIRFAQISLFGDCSLAYDCSV